RQRFVSHPFQPGSSARLYRTGDLARLDEQGRICFLGRVDAQVKLRGFRIELGEIEAALCQHPGVRTAAVVLEQQEGREPRLVAYLVARSAQPPSREQVRAFLAHRLPEVMIPAVCVPLDALPLTPNGKLDRRRLPAPDGQSAVFAPTHAIGLARNPIEETLVALWRDALHLSQISIHDDFFALGGHSLLATRIVSQIHTQLEVDLPIAALFNHPTVAKLAYFIASALAGGQEEAYPPLQPVDRTQSLPLSFAQQRLWFL